MNRPDATPPNMDQWIQEAFNKDMLKSESSNHPDEALLLDYVYEQLEPTELARLSAHVSKCVFCTQQTELLRNELAEIDPALASALEAATPQIDVSVEPQESEKSSTTLWQNLMQKMNQWFGSRRAFIGHTLTYAAAGAALIVVFVGNITSPLQSTGGVSALEWFLRFFGVAWLIYFPIIVFHGVRARKKK